MQTILFVLNLIAISQFICKEEDFNISYFDKSSIETITDSNFDQVMNAGIINDYIILFTIKKCEGCDQVLKSLEKAAEYYFRTNSNITFYKIEWFPLPHIRSYGLMATRSWWQSLKFGFKHIRKGSATFFITKKA